MTRIAFGKCVAWPHDLPCDQARAWVRARSKGTLFDGVFGAHRLLFHVQCFPELERLYFPVQLLHPDETSKPQSGWVCCVDMETGRLWENNRDKFCRQLTDWETENKPFFCTPAYNPALIDEETAKLDPAV